MTDSRHRQLSRIFQRKIEDDEHARAAISADPGVLASALFLEAVESDDVTSVEGALGYLADRLRELQHLVGENAALVESEFATKVQAWR